MKLISIRSQIKEVADRWKESYLGHTWMGQNKKEIFDKLKKLDPETATKEDVASIVGNYSWAKEKQCYECGEYFETVIELGETPPNYESYTTYLCLGCVKKAVVFFEENK